MGSGPYYVLQKEKKSNRLIVTKNKHDLYSRGFSLNNLYWVQGEEPFFPFSAQAQIRYQSSVLKGQLLKKENKCYWQCISPQWAVTPGQSVVFYKGGQMMGGGIITK